MGPRCIRTVVARTMVKSSKVHEFTIFKATGIRPMTLFTDVHSTIYDNEILNFWRTESCSEITHRLLVFV